MLTRAFINKRQHFAGRRNPQTARRVERAIATRQLMSIRAMLTSSALCDACTGTRLQLQSRSSTLHTSIKKHSSTSKSSWKNRFKSLFLHCKRGLPLLTHTVIAACTTSNDCNALLAVRTCERVKARVYPVPLPCYSMRRRFVRSEKNSIFCDLLDWRTVDCAVLRKPSV